MSIVVYADNLSENRIQCGWLPGIRQQLLKVGIPRNLVDSESAGAFFLHIGKAPSSNAITFCNRQSRVSNIDWVMPIHASAIPLQKYVLLNVDFMGVRSDPQCICYERQRAC